MPMVLSFIQEDIPGADFFICHDSDRSEHPLNSQHRKFYQNISEDPNNFHGAWPEAIATETGKDEERFQEVAIMLMRG